MADVSVSGPQTEGPEHHIAPNDQAFICHVGVPGYNYSISICHVTFSP